MRGEFRHRLSDEEREVLTEQNEQAKARQQARLQAERDAERQRVEARQQAAQAAEEAHVKGQIRARFAGTDQQFEALWPEIWRQHQITSLQEEAAQAHAKRRAAYDRIL